MTGNELIYPTFAELIELLSDGQLLLLSCDYCGQASSPERNAVNLLTLREEYFLHIDFVMNAGMYRILQVLSVTVILGAAMLLSFILIWLVQGHGVIACGRGIFDDPIWYLAVALLIGIPLTVMAGGGVLFLWCSSRRLCVK